MFSKGKFYMIGFHGCDMKIRDKIVLHQEKFIKSVNDHDWLGHGVYFWENDYERAFQWAKERKKNPAVIGALIESGNCLDLLEQLSRENLKIGFDALEIKFSGNLPKNKGGKDHLMRNLDCAVINAVCKQSSLKFGIDYDAVRGAFWEGDPLYPGAAIKEKSHIQICIRNLECIKAVFIP